MRPPFVTMGLSALVVAGCHPPSKEETGTLPVDTAETATDTASPDTSAEPERECDDLPWTYVAVGAWAGCGIHTDGCLECWGNEGISPSLYGLPSHTTGFVQVEVADPDTLDATPGNICGLRDDGSVECWGTKPTPEEAPVPGGVYIGIALGSAGACGVRDDQSIACWGWVDPPAEGSYLQVAVNYTTVSVLTTEGIAYHDGEVFGGGEVFSFLSSAGDCGVTPEQEVICYWEGDNFPTEEVDSISTGDVFACAVLVSGQLYCWGVRDDFDDPILDAPPGEFSDVSCNFYSCCAVSVEGDVACWGYDRRGMTTPPGSYVR